MRKKAYTNSNKRILYICPSCDTRRSHIFPRQTIWLSEDAIRVGSGKINKS